jgi:energy-coupling factor transporter ATP-binding protein EcfA2
VGLQVVGWLMPLGGVLQAVGIVPFAALAARHRPRAVLVGASCGAAVGFLVAGAHLSAIVAGSALVGLAVGRGIARGWGLVRTSAVALATAGAPAAALSVLALGVFASLRRLSLRQVQVGWAGVRRVLGAAGLHAAVLAGNGVVDAALRWWWVSVPTGELLLVGFAGLLTRVVAEPVLEALAQAAGGVPEPLEGGDDVPPAPVPVRLVGVRHRYAGAEAEALAGVDVEVPERGLVVVAGPNGSGKSTLVRVLAGMRPSAGRVERPGGAGLGVAGGTAIVFQRPESQVLGVRVGDDVVWGLPDGHGVDVAALLEAVGLEGMAAQETSTLSGGQLQRLAIAAALARRPRLLLSDESTAMLDPEGRAEVTALLRRLAETLAVVHVTHHEDELDGAAVVRLDRGRVVVEPEEGQGRRGARPGRSGGAWTGRSPPLRRPDAPGLRRPDAPGLRRPDAPGSAGPLLRLVSVGHVYAAGTPWARRALLGVDLELEEGEGLVVVGPNGSGKSTLAWVLAGLIEPTEGSALLGGRPISEQVGRVGIAFQHARLQLFRPTVGADVAWGTDLGPTEVAAALAEVGLGPEGFEARRIDALSGGEQRRVALAGMLARRPPLLVLDEPLAGLDEGARDGLCELLAQLRAEAGIATVVVTHDLAAAPRLGSRVVAVDGGVVRPIEVAAGGVRTLRGAEP